MLESCLTVLPALSLHSFCFIVKKTKKSAICASALTVQFLPWIWKQKTSNIRMCMYLCMWLMLCTHDESAWSVGAWPTDQLVSLASQSECNTRPSRLTTDEWKLDAQKLSTCRTAIDVGRHHPQSQTRRSSRTLSSALSPTSPPADHLSSTTTLMTALYLMS